MNSSDGVDSRTLANFVAETLANNQAPPVGRVNDPAGIQEET